MLGFFLSGLWLDSYESPGFFFLPIRGVHCRHGKKCGRGCRCLERAQPAAHAALVSSPRRPSILPSVCVCLCVRTGPQGVVLRRSRSQCDFVCDLVALGRQYYGACTRWCCSARQCLRERGRCRNTNTAVGTATHCCHPDDERNLIIILPR